jgi:putative ATP-dependent endonuclease of OLD family
MVQHRASISIRLVAGQCDTDSSSLPHSCCGVNFRLSSQPAARKDGIRWGQGVRIEKVKVEGFRLLEDLEIMLEPGATVIVGRNNSGKTSLTDVFERFVAENGPAFRLQDFSAGVRGKFFDAWELREKGEPVEAILAKLPTIAITLTLRYDKAAPDLGPLSPFIIDLDAECTQAIARIEYGPTLACLTTLFNLPLAEAAANLAEHFFRCLRETLPRAYTRQVFAIDPTDPTNRRAFDGTSALAALVQSHLVRAQRTLDHSGHGDPFVIGKTLSTLYKTATADTAAEADQALAAQLKSAVESIEHDVQKKFDTMLTALLPALQVFGFPSLNDTELRPETSLNVEALLSDHTKIVYAGADGVHLPEHYNGLGTRNLIYMLLQLESYHKAYRARAMRPVTHLIFIEEPEAHLHPQMQEVFITQLTEAAKTMSANYPGEEAWPVQFVISTHSSHVANAANFDAIRYFLNESPGADQIRRTKVKDFKKHSITIPPEDQEFLQQYMTLTKCDLYFADKAILIEGPTERILMPRLCELVDAGLPNEAKLARQYVTTLEVGGAYAHLFYPLLDFLELKSLVITDLDSTKTEIRTKNDKERKVWVKCPVAKGERTSNAAISNWFAPKPKPESEPEDEDEDDQTGAGSGKEAEVIDPDRVPLTLEALIAMPDVAKSKGFRRIAYQVPEEVAGKECARSYEDALVLANIDRFDLPGEDDKAIEAWELASTFNKTDMALRFALKEKNWIVPRYIREGLIWLSEPPPPPSEAPPINGEGDKAAPAGAPA